MKIQIAAQTDAMPMVQEAGNTVQSKEQTAMHTAKQTQAKIQI